MGIFRATYSSFRSRRARRVLKKLGSRRSIFEQLECRELLAVDWRNPVDALDVNADGATVPIDALNVINDLNANGSRQLPAVKDPTKPFLDTDGDQFIAPLDVLQVVNGLNSGNVSPFRLNEGNSLARESTVTITLGQPAGTRTYRLQIDSTFDNTGTQSDVGDVLAVYLVNPNDHSETLLDRGTPGTALFTLTNGQAEFQLGTVRWDGSVLEIDLSQLPQLETGVLKLQLLSADNDFGTNITVQPLTNEVDPQGTPGNVFPSTPPLVPDGPLNVSQLAPLTSVEANFQNVRFDTTTGRLAAEVQLRNNGAAVSRNVAVAFPGLPTGVSLLNSAGTTATGAPFVNWQSALSGGGLPTGASSERMLVELDNPDNIQFPLVTEVLGAANRPPVFDPITAVNVSPGGVVNVALNATDPDGDQVTFSLDGAQPLPTGKLNANGTLTFTPVPADIGSYQLNVIASDGASTVTQTTTVNVVADPVTTTRVSGVVLDIDQTPLAGMQVEIGAVQGLTQADGSFTLDLGTGPVVGDTLKIRGETFPGPLIYPFIAEKLPFILEHDVLAGVNNVIGRPIFLPPLDVANGDTINPAQDTTVDTAAIPGASVFVKAGTLMNQQGTPFNGVLSITEVPVDRTPAALPDVLAPDLVVTIQPGEMVFATPASLTLPNLAGHAPGTEMDLWSINPISGEFDNVGTGRVTADGELVETISGGIRNSSWHFFAFQFAFQLALLRNLLENLEGNSNNQATFDSCEDCPPLFGTAKVDTGSQVELHSGVLFEDHQLVGYQSLGQQQSFRLQYNSLHADPRPIIHFAIDNAFGNSIGPVVDVAIARMSFTRNGVTQEVPGFTPPPGAFGLFFPGEHFWRIPQGTNRIDVALQANLAASPTGRYDFDVSWGIHRFSGLSSRSGASQEFNRREVVINKRQSVFGAGWDMAGLQEIFENEDGSILLVDGDREVIYEAPPNAGDPFVSPAADFGVMEKLPDGTYRYTDKFQTVTQFNDERKVASVTDRNGNRTTFDYDQTNNITKITDPVGLSTTFSYSDGRVSSITDPAGRVTQLIYNNIGDLIEIRDPDATRRRFEYDTEHRMTAEVDQRGNREEEVYGFHGRIIQTKDKDGSVRQFAPSQIQGLLPASQTVNRSSPPLAPIVPQNIAVATHTEPNGNVIVTTMNQAGAEIAKSDSVGALPTTTRLPNGFVSRKTDARGHVTDFTYDDRGNMLTIRDELTPANQSGGGGLFPGQQFAGSSFGNAADAQVGDLNNDGFDDFVTANETGNTASVYLSDGRGGLGNGTNLALAGRATNVAMGDLDNDGDRDLVAGHLTQQNTETISVFFNDGTGTFGARVELGTEPSDLSGGIVVDDLDDDGNADIVTALRNRTATIFFGDGTGAFPTRINHSIPTPFGSPADVKLADMDGNGLLDLVVLYFNIGLIIVPNTGNRTFGAQAQPISFSGLHFDLADFNGDNRLDAVILDSNSARMRAFLNQGNNTFGPEIVLNVGNAFPGFVRAVDLGGDGDLDIIVNQSFFPGNDDGTFGTRVDFASHGARGNVPADVGDINGDGLPDLVAAAGQSDAPVVFLGSRAAGIEGSKFSAGPTSPNDIRLFDLNNDTFLDVVTTGNTVSVLNGDGTGGFAGQVNLLTNDFFGDVAAADLERDGDIDLVATNSSDSVVSVLRRDGAGFTRTDFATGRGPRGVALGDVNGDNIPDLLNADAADDTVSVRLGNGAGGFGDRVTFPVSGEPINIAVGDLEPDGDLDVVVVVRTALATGVVAVLLNTGGVFSAPTFLNTNGFPFDVVLRDLNADNVLDIITGSETAQGIGSVGRFLGLGNGQFSGLGSIGLPVPSRNIEVADLDGDGQLDVASLNITILNASISQLSVFLGDGQGQLGNRTDYTAPPGALALGDLDRDGDTDALLSSSLFFLPNRTDPEAQPAKRFTFDAAFNQPTGSTDELGRQTLITVDPANGNALSIATLIGAPGGGDDLTLSFTYNARGQVVTETDPLGRVTENEYDAFGRLIRVTVAKGTPDQAEERFEYDAAGNQTASVDERGNRSEFTYDAMNRVVKIRDPIGNETVIAYDPRGNETSRTDPRGNVTEFEYDVLDRRTRTIDALDGVSTEVYDAEGNVIAKIDELGRREESRYDLRNRVVEVTDAAGGIIRNEYDADNNLIQIIDQLGNTNRIEYDARNRQTAMIDALGGITRNTYDAADQVLAAVDPLNRTTRFEYDDAGRTTAIIDPLGGATRMEFDLAGNVVTSTDPLGRVTRTVYDNRDRKIRETDPAGGTMRFTYDASDNLVSEEDQLGRVTQHAYDTNDRITKTTDPLGNVTERTYDAAGNVVATTDQRGNKTEYVFDVLNREVQQIDPLDGVRETTYDAAGQAVTRTDELGRHIRFTYDALGNVATTIDALGNITRNTYDARSDLTAITDELGFVTRTQYDALHRKTQFVDPLGNVSVFAYDAIGNLTSETDPRGNRTQTAYDALDRSIQTTDALGEIVAFSYDAAGQLLTQTDELGNVTGYTYDLLGNVTKESRPLGRDITYTYDAVSNRLTATDTLGATLTYVYDALDRVTSTRDPLGNVRQSTYDGFGNETSFTDPSGNVTQKVYDALNRQVGATDPLGGTVAYVFDVASQLTRVTDQLGRSTNYSYDALGRQLTITDALNHTVTNTYDAVGNKSSVTDALGQKTQFTFDALRRQLTRTDPRGGVTQQTYDAVGNTTSITDPSGNVTSYAYDELNRVVSETNAQGAVRQYAYDAEGKLIERTDRLARRTTFQFDAADRVVREDWFVPGNATPVNTIAMTYDRADQVLTYGDSFANYTNTYDAGGQLTLVSNADTPGLPPVVFAYTYDPNGRITSAAETINGAAAATTNYAYDANSRMTRITQTGTGVRDKRVDYRYDAVGQHAGIDRFGDLAGAVPIATTAYTFDVGGRPTQVVHSRGGTNFNTFTSTFDAVNQLTERTSTDGTSAYQYDASNQLTSANHDFQTDETYAYDLAGNRTGTGVVIETNNRLQAAAGFTYEYDAEGNRTRQTETATGVVTDFTYDHRNRLVAATRKSSDGTVLMQANYVYDAYNRRIAKSVDADGAGAATARAEQFVHDFRHATLFFDAGNLARRALIGNAVDQVLAEETATELSWRLTDPGLTVTDVLDAIGNPAGHLTYDSFGNVTSATQAAADLLFTYAGREHDDETGVYYNRNRYLDPLTGRFISEDPIAFASGDLNLFRYVHNNPVNFYDPNGTEEEEERGFWGSLYDGLATVGNAAVNVVGSGVQLVADGVDTVFGESAFDTGTAVVQGTANGIANSATFGTFDYAREYLVGDTGTHSKAFKYANIAGDIGFSIATIALPGQQAKLLKRGKDLAKLGDDLTKGAVEVAKRTNGKAPKLVENLFRDVDRVRNLQALNKLGKPFAVAQIIGQPARGIIGGLQNIFDDDCLTKGFGVLQLLLGAFGLRAGAKQATQLLQEARAFFQGGAKVAAGNQLDDAAVREFVRKNPNYMMGKGDEQLIKEAAKLGITPQELAKLKLQDRLGIKHEFRLLAEADEAARIQKFADEAMAFKPKPPDIPTIADDVNQLANNAGNKIVQAEQAAAADEIAKLLGMGRQEVEAMYNAIGRSPLDDLAAITKMKGPPRDYLSLADEFGIVLEEAVEKAKSLPRINSLSFFQ